MGPRKSKKSETLQVRLPYGMKKDFMERVQMENRSASDLIRDFIEDYLAGPVEILNSPTAVMIRRRFIYPTLMAAGLVGAVIVFMPNPGNADALRPEFGAMDKDGDGFITIAEYVPTGVDKLLHPAPRMAPRVGPDGINLYAPDGTPLRIRPLMPGAKGADAVAKPGDVLLTVTQIKKLSLSYFDGDGDGKLSFQEYKDARLRGARASFERYDTDLNDRISQDEYVRGRVPGLNREFLQRAPAEHREQAMRKAPQMRDMAIRNFKALDANRDGVVTRDEMIPA